MPKLCSGLSNQPRIELYGKWDEYFILATQIQYKWHTNTNIYGIYEFDIYFLYLFSLLVSSVFFLAFCVEEIYCIWMSRFSFSLKMDFINKT